MFTRILISSDSADRISYHSACQLMQCISRYH